MWDILFESIIVSIIAMAITFVLMGLLIGFIMLFKYIFSAKDKPSGTIQGEAETVEAPKPYIEKGIDGETVAAISAAIAACLESEARLEGVPVSGFVVRTIRKRI